MKAAWDLGINTFDTANTYSNGDAEKMIAKFAAKVEADLVALLTRAQIDGLLSMTSRARIWSS